jgi:hypothetical protein
MILGLASIIGISGLIGTVVVSVFKIGKWTGTVNKSLQELTEQQKAININLTNHIHHYDNELTDIRIELVKMNKRLK